MFVAFEGLGGGIGHVLVGGIVAVCSMSVVISSPEVLSLSCWFLVVFGVFGTGMHDGLGSIVLCVLGGVIGM